MNEKKKNILLIAVIVILVLAIAAVLVFAKTCKKKDEAEKGGTTEEVTTAEITTAEITTAEITTAEITTSEITTAEITTSEITTAEITTAQITTAEITTAVVTTEIVTTEPVTTEIVTTKPVTTKPVTTKPVTTKPVTTKPVTTKPVTTAPVTKPVTPSTLRLTSDYVIITPANASEMEKYGAEVVRDKIKSLSGATLPIKTDAEPEGLREILIGNTNRALSKSAQKGLSAKDYAVCFDGYQVAIAGINVYHSYVGVDHFVKEMLPKSGTTVSLSTKNYVFDYETMDPEADETKIGTLGEIYKSIADPNGRLMFCAHRGDHIGLPANAIVGITSAIDNVDADIIEIDLQKTKDGYWVLCHDSTLTNTTNCKDYIGKSGWPTNANVSSWTLAQIKQLKLEKTNYTMPTYEEILDVARGKVLLALDKVVSAGGLSACEELYEIAWKNCAVETMMFQCYGGNALPNSFFQKMYNETGIRLVKHSIYTSIGFLNNYQEVDYMIQTLQISLGSDAEYLSNDYLKKAAGKCRLWVNTLNGSLEMTKDKLSTWKALYEAGYSMIQTDQPYKLHDYVLQTVAQGGRTGDLKVGEDITIGSVSDWNNFVSSVNAGTSYNKCTVTLTKDIDLGGATISPIGTESRPFCGTFVGNGHTISNFKINAGDKPAGLFATTVNAKITDLKVKNFSVTGNVLQVAGLVGGAYSTEISGCSVENATIKSTSTSNSFTESGKGGLVGYATGSKITNCSVTGVTISGHRDVGGMFGDIANCTIENCTATNVSVTATGNSVGAFAGNNHDTKVSNSSVTGTVVDTAGNNIGAFAGYTSGTSDYQNCTYDSSKCSLDPIGKDNGHTGEIKDVNSGKINLPADVFTSVKWNAGYVGSSANLQGYKNMIKPNGGGYIYTDVITVKKAGTTVFFSSSSAPSARAYVFSVWKNDGGSWKMDLSVPQYSGGDTNVQTLENGVYTFAYTTSSDNEHIRVCASASSVSAAPTLYTADEGKTGTAKAYFDTLGAATHTNLSGKTINFIGDSYFEGNGLGTNQVWCIRLAIKYGMQYQNYGINGAMTSTNGGHDPMVNRIDSMADNDPDIVIFEGGKNDFNNSTPIGTIDSTDTNTFMGALNVAITKLKAKYPNATLMGVTVWNFSGSKTVGGKTLTCNDYADAMIAVCQKYGIPCFDARDKTLSGVDMTSSSFRSSYCMTATDVSHLNDAGHRLFLPQIEAFIAENYKK